MTADVITLRMAARDSAEQFRNLSGHPDPLAKLLPGEGTEVATADQVAQVQTAITDRQLRQHLFADGTPMARNVALLRSELRRWAIRNPVRG